MSASVYHALAISLPSQVNYDGTIRSSLPLDGLEIPPPPMSDYIERCLGTNWTTCDTTEDIDGAGTATIQTNLSNRRTGLTGLSFQIASGDGRATAQVDSIAGTNTFRAAGVAIYLDDGMDVPDELNGWRCQEPATAGQTVRLIPIVDGVQGTVQYSGSTDNTLPELLTIQYRDSTDTIECLEWNTTESEWDLVGSIAVGVLTDYHLVISAESDSPAGNSATAEFSAIAIDTSLQVIGDDSPPPDPDPDPTPMSGIGDYDDPVDGVTPLGGRSAANCNTNTCIQNNLVCGRTITLTGTIAGNVSLSSGACAANNPIEIDGNGQQATGVWTYESTSARQIVHSVNFTNGTATAQVVFQGTNNHHIGNTHTNWGSNDQNSAFAMLVSRGTQGEIAYNRFEDPGDWPTSPTGTPLRMAVRTNENSVATFMTDVWFHHNYCFNFPEKPGGTYSSGQNDCLEVGTSSTSGYSETVCTGWYIERNLVRDHRQGGGDTGAATIDIKHPGCVVARYNTFDGLTTGRLDLRGGNLCNLAPWVEGNNIPAGSTIHGCGARLLGNRGPLTLRSGNTGCELNIADGGHHATVCDAIVEGGDGNLNVGAGTGPTPYIDVTDTIIRARVCTGVNITTANASGTVNGCHNTPASQAPAQLVWTAYTSISVTAATVGPDAMQFADAAWRTPRLQ